MSPETILLAAGFVLGGTLLLAAIVRGLDAVLPDRFIRERHDMSLAALLIVPVMFGLTFLPAPIGNHIITVPELVDHGPINLIGPDSEEAAFVATPTLIAPAVTTVDVPWAKLALAIWAVGTLISLAVLATRLIRLNQLRRSARPVDLPNGMRLSRPIDVSEHDQIGSPMLAGYFKPNIIVPTGFSFGAAARPVLEHEVAHAARGDSWITLSLHLLNTIFWWNLPQRLITPLYYAARESLCDTRAAIITGAPETLAQALVDTAVEANMRRSPELAAAAHGTDLKARVRRLMSPTGAVERSPMATLTFILPVMIGIAVVTTPGLGAADQSSGENAERYTDNDDDTLYGAAIRGEIADVQARIAAGADPSAALPGDGTPLMAAIRGEEDEIVNLLLEMGVDVNRPSQGDGTALISAVRAERADYVEKLLSEGADPNIAIEGDGSALISAAMRGNIQIIDRLLDAGADPNIAVPRDGNPLIGAALHGETEAASRLLAAGADPNGYVFRDETPLINAAQQGELAMVKLLVTAGADVSLTVETPHHDPGGAWRSPLSEAERNGHSDVVQWLREMGAEHRPGN
ncbi:MAG: ankyrin repeat domain-containing protein [Pseudomonadota bacterium]